ncbi:ribonuclease H-like domain-containing protein [Mycena leptocephala]|nr:ribonuclease H-like domain-containing protein [Mycena leptocephala]
MEADFVLCDKESELSAVTDALRESSTLILDCEGTNLGVKKSGRLTLISLGTQAPNQEQAYLIDVLAIGKDGLKPIFDILESNKVRKVVFDGRMDQSALFHEYGVTMQNVVDLQLADIKSRHLRGEEEGSAEQMDRLSPYLQRSEVRANMQLYTKVQRLAGLRKALEEHDVEVEEGKLKMKTQGSGYCSSPPDREQLLYAANDIWLISRLLAHFEQAGYLDVNLPEESLRYVTMWVDNQPEGWRRQDKWKLHALLPLAILDATPAYARTQRCIGCTRHLPQNCFSKVAWSNNKKCLVCRAIGIREIREREIAEREYEDDDVQDELDYLHTDPDEDHYYDSDEDHPYDSDEDCCYDSDSDNS